MNDTIETWKLDLERLLWSYYENGRPDGKTGVIGNPKTIEEFVKKLIKQHYEKGAKDLAHQIDCNTLISELTGWKAIVEMSVDEVLEKNK